jgi:hypothetical protein
MTGVPVFQSSGSLLLRIDRKRRFGKQQQSQGILFQEIIFFSFSFSRTERTRFGWCGLRVNRHADQPKQVTRLVPCGMVELQPGYQSCNGLRLSCCASIANDKSASNNSFGEFSFVKSFSFSFSRTERTRFGWWGLRVDRHADQPKQVARLVPCGMIE